MVNLLLFLIEMNFRALETGLIGEGHGLSPSSLSCPDVKFLEKLWSKKKRRSFAYALGRGGGCRMTPMVMMLEKKAEELADGVS